MRRTGVLSLQCAGIHAGVLRGMFRRMKQQTPEKLDLRLPTELRMRLDDRAQKENRSRNAQAVYFIQCGLEGLDMRDITQSIHRIENDIAKIQQAIDILLRR